MTTTHTPGPWHAELGDSEASSVIVSGDVIIADVHTHLNEATGHADANLITAAPELKNVAENFQITGPDGDGYIWLVLHGNGTTGKAMFNLGYSKGIAASVALLLEEDRRAAIAKATQA